MKTTHLAWCFSVGMCMPGWLQANPIGGVVARGNASISALPGTLTIHQTSPKVIINWQNFSIGPGEVTRFVQPSANAAALNRVVTADPSRIMGSLRANGQVYLINPNGIVFGRSAQVNVGGMVASTLDLGPDQDSANARFLAGGDFTFLGSSPAAVRNEGTISGRGDIFLIARRVENAGAISGRQVGLAGGAEVELRQAGRERIGVIAGEGSVDNAGAISAVAAELKANGGNIYSLAVNNGGVVRANSLVADGGSIFLRASRGAAQNSGALDASSSAPGGRGGVVQVLGEHVLLTGDAKVDASGDAGGGRILIGGGFQGRNPALANAQHTFLGKDVTIHADARSSGNGGTVVVWSDDYTRFEGTITARGGSRGGNGGLIETSGKNFLDITRSASVNASAPNGLGGTWLLDPTDFTIVATPPGGDLDPTGPPYTPTANVNTIGADDIEAVLDAGTSVSINTSSAFAGLGNITVEAPITKTAGGNAGLSLTADNDIIVNAGAGISSTSGQLNLSLSAGNAVTLNDALSANGGTVTIGHAGPLTGSGLIIAATLTLSGAGNVGVDATTRLNTDVDTIDFNKTGGNSFIAEANAVALQGTTGGGNLDLTGGALTLSAGLNAGAVTLAGTTIGLGAFNLTGSSVNLTHSGALTDAGGQIISGGTLTLSGAGNVGVDATDRLNTDVATIDFNKTGGNSFIAEADAVALQGTTGGGNLDLTGGALTLSAGLNAGAVALSSTTIGLGVFNLNGSSVNLTHSGALTDAGGQINSAGTLTLSGAGNVGVDATDRLGTDVATIDFNKTGGNSFIAEANAVALQGTTGGGNLDLTGGALTLSAGLNAGAVALSGATIGLGTFNLNGSSVNLTHSGALTDAGGQIISLGTLTLSGAGNIGASPADRLGTDVATIDFNKTGGNSFIAEANAVALQGTTGGGNLDLTGGALTLSAGLNAGATTLAGTTIGLGAFNLSGSSVNLTHSGALTDAGGQIISGGTLTLSGAGNVGASPADRLGTDVATIDFNKTGGNSFIAEANAVALQGTTSGGNLDLTGGALTLSGGLNAGAVVLSGTTIGLGAFNLSGSSVNLTHSGALTDAGGQIISAGTLTLSGGGNVGVDATDRLGTDVATIIFNKTGGNSFIAEANTVALQGTTGGGNLDLTGGALLLSGGLNAGAVVLSGTTIGLGVANLNGSSVNLTHSGALTDAGGQIISPGTLTLSGSGNVGVSPADRLGTDVATIIFNKVGGNSFIAEANTVALQGTTGGGTLDLAGGALLLSGVLNAGAVTLSGTTIGLGTANLNGSSVNLTHSGALTDAGGQIITPGTLTLSGGGNVGVNPGDRLGTDVATIIFNKVGGNSFINEANDVNLQGTTGGGGLDLTGGALTLSAGLNAGAVTLSGTTIGLGAFDLNGSSVNLTHSGALTDAGGQIVSLGTLTLSGTGDVGVNAGNRLGTDVATIIFNKTGGNSFIAENDGVALQGTTSGGALDLTGGALTLSAGLNAGAVALSGTTIGLGAFNLSGSSVNLTHSGGLSDAGGQIISPGTLTLSGAGAVGVNPADRLGTDVAAIILNKAGGNSFINEANDVNLQGSPGGGSLDLIGQALALSGNLDAGGGNITLSGTTIGLSAFELRGNRITLDHSGTLGGSGLITAGRLILAGTGQVGDGPAFAQWLRTDVGTIQFAKVAGDNFINEANDVNLEGSTGGNLMLLGGALALSGNLDASGGNITFSHSGTLGGSGLITAGRLTLAGTGQVGDGPAFAQWLRTDVDTIQFAKGAGDSFINEANDVNLEGGTTGRNIDLIAAGITISGRLDAGDVTLTHSGALTDAAGGLIAASTLTLAGSGAIGTLGNRLDTEVADLVFNKTGGDSFIAENSAANLRGTTGGGNLDLTAVWITVNGLLTAGDVTFTHNGELTDTGAGLINAATLTLAGGGDVGTLANRLNTEVTSLVFNKTGGRVFIAEATDANLRGTTAGDVDLTGAGLTVDAPLSAGVITLNHSGLLSDSGAGQINALTLNLSGAGNVGSSGNPLNTSVNTLSLAKTGGDSFIAEADTIGVSGSTGGGSLQIAASDVTITDTLNTGGGSIRFDHSGSLSGNGPVSGGTLTLAGSGNVGNSTADRFHTDVDRIVFAKTGGDSFIDELNAVGFEGLTGGGSLDLVGQALSLSENFDAGAGAVTLLGTTIGLDAFNLNAGPVRLTHSGLLSDAGGRIITPGTLTLLGGGEVGSAGNRLDTDVNTIEFAKSGGNAFIAEANDVNLQGTTVGDIDLAATGITINAPLNGADITLDHSGTLSDAGSGQINAATLTLAGSGQVASLADPLSIDVANLVFNKTGGNSFVAEANDLNLRGTTSGNLDLTAQGITINGLLTAADVALTHSGALTDSGGGRVNAANLFLMGAGNVGSAGNRLNIDAGTLFFAKSGGNSFIAEANDLNLQGTTPGNIDLTAAGLTISAPLTAADVTLTHSGALTPNPGGRITADSLTLAGAGAVGSASARLDIDADNLVLDKSGGDSFIAEADAVTLQGNTGGGSLDVTSPALTLAGALNAGGGDVTLASPTISLAGDTAITARNFNYGASDINGNQRSLTLDIGGAVTLASAQIQNIGTLTTRGAGSATLIGDPASTRTFGSDSFNDFNSAASLSLQNSTVIIQGNVHLDANSVSFGADNLFGRPPATADNPALLNVTQARTTFANQDTRIDETARLFVDGFDLANEVSGRSTLYVVPEIKVGAGTTVVRSHISVPITGKEGRIVTRSGDVP